MKLNEKIFREYDIRGVADADLNPEVTEGLSRAIATFVRAQKGRTIALGRDCRVSSPRLHEALRKGFQAGGLDVVDIGQVPTPLLYFAVVALPTDSGVMITGSHNPAEQNGFKICVGPSTIHGEDIQKIKEILKQGDFSTGKGSYRTEDVQERYLEKVLSSIAKPLSLTIVVDNGNGMGGPIALELYRRLGCEVIDLFTEPDGTFPNHHPDPTVPENLRFLIEEVRKRKTVAGIGFDGDADRIGVVDRSGRVIYGDELLVLYARDILKTHPGATIISEVKSSHRLFEDIAKHGGRGIMWKTGHSLIKAKMKAENALLAGEMSGHIFFSDRYYGYDDAIYAGARLLEILHATGKTPGELLADLPASFSTPEIRVACPDESKFQVVELARRAFKDLGLKVNGIDGARVEFSDGWGLVRASNTQPVLVYRFEANSAARLREIRELMESTVAQLLTSAKTIA